MKPVDQTRFGVGEPDIAPGNCWAACIASILELRLEDLPDELDHWRPGCKPEESWLPHFREMADFLRSRNFCLAEVACRSLTAWDPDYFQPYLIISGPSPRNPKVNHAVVGRGNEYVHDPHPSRKFLAQGELFYELLLPLDAAKAAA